MEYGRIFYNIKEIGNTSITDSNPDFIDLRS